MTVISMRINDTEPANWEQENQTGRELALQTIAHMRLLEAPNYLGQVAKEMIERGRYGGVEVGFFHTLAVMIR